MSNKARFTPEEVLPRNGKVNEMCQEWMVREDSALAYRLQNQEFTDHLSGNRFRNALVREDFPRAKNEQQKEQELAEQAAAVYQRMLQEQEEHDQKVAKELAEKLERDEKVKKRAVELRDQDIARQMLERERVKVDKFQQIPPLLPPHHLSPSKPALALPPRIPIEKSPHRPNSMNYQAHLPQQVPIKRQGLAMPLPYEINTRRPTRNDLQGLQNNVSSAELYTEPYKPLSQHEDMDRIDVVAAAAADIPENLGIPLNQLTLKQIQEEKDAQLARKLQAEEEGNIENSLLNRDRLLAIEAQDKELAKLLQERERAKAKRAREKAKQKALAKKQQNPSEVGPNPDCASQILTDGAILPDDSYAFPLDIITQSQSSVPRNISAVPDIYTVPNPEEEEISYSLPADVVFDRDTPKKSSINGMGSGNRPTHLELKSSHNKINKLRMPEPAEISSDVLNTSGSGSLSGGTSPLHSNIAMAIDPTYSRRGGRPPSSYDTSSSTVTTSTSSSSPGMVHSLTECVENLDDDDDDDSPAPPYMPIQGQRRTASLEKKKKKFKDGGCKQQ